MFHDEKEAASDFSCIEWKYAYLLILELTVLIEKMSECDEEVIVFLIRQTHHTDAFDVFYALIDCIRVIAVLEEVVESLKYLEAAAVDVLSRDIIEVEVQDIRESKTLIILYLKGCERTLHERVESGIISLDNLSHRFHFAEGVLETCEYDTVIQRDLFDGFILDSEKIEKRTLVDGGILKSLSVVIGIFSLNRLFLGKTYGRERAIWDHDGIDARSDALPLRNVVR